MPEIKYWSGIESFSDYTGHYKADTLAESIDLFLDNQTASQLKVVQIINRRL